MKKLVCFFVLFAHVLLGGELVVDAEQIKKTEPLDMVESVSVAVKLHKALLSNNQVVLLAAVRAESLLPDGHYNIELSVCIYAEMDVPKLGKRVKVYGIAKKKLSLEPAKSVVVLMLVKDPVTGRYRVPLKKSKMFYRVTYTHSPRK